MSVFRRLFGSVSADRAQEIARQEARRRGWPWLGPVTVIRHIWTYTIRTNDRHRGSCLRFSVSARTGLMMGARYLGASVDYANRQRAGIKPDDPDGLFDALKALIVELAQGKYGSSQGGEPFEGPRVSEVMSMIERLGVKIGPLPAEALAFIDAKARDESRFDVQVELWTPDECLADVTLYVIATRGKRWLLQIVDVVPFPVSGKPR